MIGGIGKVIMKLFSLSEGVRTGIINFICIFLFTIPIDYLSSAIWSRSCFKSNKFL